MQVVLHTNVFHMIQFEPGQLVPCGKRGFHFLSLICKYCSYHGNISFSKPIFSISGLRGSLLQSPPFSLGGCGRFLYSLSTTRKQENKIINIEKQAIISDRLYFRPQVSQVCKKSEHLQLAKKFTVIEESDLKKFRCKTHLSCYQF